MINVEAYNPLWSSHYEQEAQRILEKAGTWISGIEHIGSTAIKGLPAKPTIDIAVGVNDLSLADRFIVSQLKELGYSYLPELETQIPERRYLQQLDPEGRHLFHVHVLIINHVLWTQHLKFRDYLRSHPEEANTYALLKQQLQEKFKYDRKAYTEGKAEFTRKILSKTD